MLSVLNVFVVALALYLLVLCPFYGFLGGDFVVVVLLKIHARDTEGLKREASFESFCVSRMYFKLLKSLCISFGLAWHCFDVSSRLFCVSCSCFAALCGHRACFSSLFLSPCVFSNYYKREIVFDEAIHKRQPDKI